MFEATTAFMLFEDLRIPYERVAAHASGLVETVSAGESGPAIMWPTQRTLAQHATPPSTSFVGGIPLLGRVMNAAQARALARRLGTGWERLLAVGTADGSEVSEVLRAEDGSILLPFDPNELTENLRAERYLAFDQGRRVQRLISSGRHAYYALRPLIPRRYQLAFRRSFSRIQQRRAFPRWPGECAVDELYAALLGLVVEIAGTAVPYIAAWPAPWTWALVLTHDVERRIGYDNLDRLIDLELELGYRSSWNFVPCNGYVVERRVLQRLARDGFEVGVHGLYHDGRDITPETFQTRLPAMRSYADHWKAVGFRSPATLRSTELLPRLGFAYDSSFSDTAPFEPQTGGCCTWFPFLIDDLVELPITLEQDHTVFDVLQRRDESLWLEKTALIRERGGMALLLTHPDYVMNPHVTASYRRFLQRHADDETAWNALPRDVAAWWRRRLRSHIVDVDGEWGVTGPAADEARVALARPERVAT